jgi:DNA-binding MarR family transcriptional regulator
LCVNRKHLKYLRRLDIRPSSEKRQVFEELLNEVRRSQNATDRYDQAVADAVGLNRTDMRCVDILDREGPATAGQLAEAMGLTTGGMTTVIDRLERAGYARRVRDPSDRRRVLVELAPEALRNSGNFYQAHLEHSERLYRRYTQQELELLLEFVREGRLLNEREAARVEGRNRAVSE